MLESVACLRVVLLCCGLDPQRLEHELDHMRVEALQTLKELDRAGVHRLANRTCLMPQVTTKFDQESPVDLKPQQNLEELLTWYL